MHTHRHSVLQAAGTPLTLSPEDVLGLCLAVSTTRRVPSLVQAPSTTRNYFWESWRQPRGTHSPGWWQLRGCAKVRASLEQHLHRQQGPLAGDKDVDPCCSVEVKYPGDIGDFTAPQHPSELVHWWNGKHTARKYVITVTKMRLSGWLVGWFIEREGWFNKKARRIHFELNPRIFLSSEQVISFWGCAAC